MTSPVIVVFAYSDVGHACLKFLLENGERVAGVFTHEDSPGEKIWFPSVAELARTHGVPVRTPVDLTDKSEIAAVKAWAPSLIFSFYYRNLIPTDILNIPTLGAYNMHGSLLPKYRGRAPVNWAVLNGEKETGATLHVMVAKADAGDIIDQEKTTIGPDDTTAEVQSRVTHAAVTVLKRQIENLKAGTAPRRVQDATQATTFGRRRPEDGRIDWTKPARDIHNLIRAVTHPYPGAFTDEFGDRLFIWKSKVVDALDENKFIIRCGDGKTLEILKAQRENEPEQDGADIVKKMAL